LYVLIYPHFFIYLSGYHSSPLSCPTRRSSDLSDRRYTVPEHRCMITHRHKSDCHSLRFSVRSHAVGAARTDKDDGAFSPRPEFLDRKSTRLNSSHVSISYAVFCLKKKKNTYIS